MIREGALLEETGVFDWCDDVLTAEVMALKFGLFLSTECGLQSPWCKLR